jgi:hypothetical protein
MPVEANENNALRPTRRLMVDTIQLCLHHTPGEDAPKTGRDGYCSRDQISLIDVPGICLALRHRVAHIIHPPAPASLATDLYTSLR